MGLAIKRDVGTFFSVTLNNLFLFAALLAYAAIASGMKPAAAMPFFFLLLLITIFPLSSDPLAKVPPDRRALWPLTQNQRIGLRLASLALSPILWIGLAVLLTTRGWGWALVFLLVALAAQIVSALGSLLLRHVPSLHPLRPIPALPGRLGGIIRNNIRQILSTLDFYSAMLFSMGAIFYRFFANPPDKAAYPVMANIVALALSTYTQCSFGLDSPSGLVRYRLLPLRGWHILLSKDIAFLAVLCVLLLPTGQGVWSGLTFGLVVIAVGRWPSLVLRLPLKRWRFAGGDLRFSLAQFVTAPAIAFAEDRVSSWFLAAAFLFYLASLLVGGWYWDSRLIAGPRTTGGKITNT